MSTNPARLASIRRRYGKKGAQVIANATPQAVLDFGQPPTGEVWVVHRVFIRGAAGQTVRLFVGSDPGDPNNADPLDEVDAISANPAVNSDDEIDVQPLQSIWALVTGIPAAQSVSGHIRYRRMLYVDY